MLRTCNEAMPEAMPEYSKWEHNCRVRAKSSVTPSSELPQKIDQVDANRSAFLGRAAKACLAELDRVSQNARDTAILNAHADPLNQEALDVLDYQGLP